jgi:protein-S-isoprenylcysteine O-methyltransferase Ste14
MPASGPQSTRPGGPLPPALFLGAVGLEVLLKFAFPAADVIPGPVRALGVALLAGGLALTVAADAQFKRVHTEIHPFGRPSALVTGGVFRVSRNPMYLGMAAALVGLALLLGSVAALLVPPLFALLLTVRFIAHEERALAERFGTDYVAYARRVRRWL